MAEGLCCGFDGKGKRRILGQVRVNEEGGEETFIKLSPSRKGKRGEAKGLDFYDPKGKGKGNQVEY